MADPTPEAVFESLRRSGFPLQTKIVREIGATEGWSRVQEEYPWQERSGKDRYLDVVAHNPKWNVTACLECKKTEKEHWIFLRPKGVGNDKDDLLQAWLLSTRFRDDYSPKRSGTFNSVWLIGPYSTEAAYCVVATTKGGRGSDKTTRRVIEDDARILIRATDAYASAQERQVPSAASESPRMYLPILVTNAPLYSAPYDPETSVSLETGAFLTDPECHRIGWVRFRKPFLSDGGEDLGDRTVFVVHARSLPEFLLRMEREQWPTPAWKYDEAEMKRRY